MKINSEFEAFCIWAVPVFVGAVLIVLASGVLALFIP